MNTKLSGAQLVVVPITHVGRNQFPYVENLRNRNIKFVDFYPATYLPDTTDNGVTTTANMFVTFSNKYGNEEFIRNLPLERLNYTQTQGVRQQVGREISLSDSYVDCHDANCVGKLAAFVMWYDLPEYSQRNKTDNIVTDSITIPLTTAIRYNQLPDSDRMSNKRFRRLLVSSPTLTPDYQTGLPYARLANLYITLRKGSYAICQNLPIMYLYQINMLQKTEFQNILFDFQSSYITIGGAGTIPNVGADYVGKSVFMNLQYEK